MTRVTLDAELKARLLNLTDDLELCDEAGKVVARVRPVIDSSHWEPREPPISEEELDAREKSTVWYSTAEVLSRLEQH